MDYDLLFVKSLLLTIFIETMGLILFFRFVIRDEKISIDRLLSAGITASFATLPYLWFVLPNWVDQKLEYVLIGESFAVLMETFIIGAILRTKLLKSFLSSLICNLTSFLIGLILNWP